MDQMRQIVEGLLIDAEDRGMTLKEMEAEVKAMLLAELTRQVANGTVESNTVRKGNPVYRINA